MASVRDNICPDAPIEIISMGSGFAGGVGASGCVCGALSGSAMAISMFCGRTEPKGPQDPKIVACLALTKELHDWFKSENGKGSTCCRVLTREFDLSKGEQVPQCIRFTGMCAGKAAEIIAREKGLKVID